MLKDCQGTLEDLENANVFEPNDPFILKVARMYFLPSHMGIHSIYDVKSYQTIFRVKVKWSKK
jgi:hypothetical protein